VFASFLGLSLDGRDAARSAAERVAAALVCPLSAASLRSSRLSRGGERQEKQERQKKRRNATPIGGTRTCLHQHRARLACYLPPRRRRSSIFRCRSFAAFLPPLDSRYDTKGPEVRHQLLIPADRLGRLRVAALRFWERRRQASRNPGAAEPYAGRLLE